jgi:hypothetical protein
MCSLLIYASYSFTYVCTLGAYYCCRSQSGMYVLWTWVRHAIITGPWVVDYVGNVMLTEIRWWSNDTCYIWSHVVRNECDYKRIESPPPPPTTTTRTILPLRIHRWQIMPWPVPTENSFGKNKDIYACRRTTWTRDRSIPSSLPTKGKIHKNIHQSPEGDTNHFSTVLERSKSVLSNSKLRKYHQMNCCYEPYSSDVCSKYINNGLHCHDFRHSFQFIWSTSVLILPG